MQEAEKYRDACHDYRNDQQICKKGFGLRIFGDQEPAIYDNADHKAGVLQGYAAEVGFDCLDK